MLAKLGKNKREIFFSILIAVFFIGLISFLIYTNVKISQKRAFLNSRIESLKKEIQEMEEKNKGLKEGISRAETREHLEEVAREQFGLKAEGEEVVVIAKEAEQGEELVQKQEKTFWLKNFWNWLTKKPSQ